MNIKMLQTEKGSPNGLVTYTYDEGAEYSVPSSLGSVFVEIGVAVDLDSIEENELLAQKAIDDEAQRLKQIEIDAENDRLYRERVIAEYENSKSVDAQKAADEAAEKEKQDSKRDNKMLDPKVEKKKEG